MFRRLIAVGSITMCAASATDVAAQTRDTARTHTRPAASPACCSVVRIDSARSIVTARETATGFTFRFEVKTRRLLRAIKLGQPVWADFTTKTVKLRAADATPCCGIIAQETP